MMSTDINLLVKDVFKYDRGCYYLLTIETDDIVPTFEQQQQLDQRS